VAVVILVVAGCGRIGFDPFGTVTPNDGTIDSDSINSGSENTVQPACLTNQAYSTTAGLTNRYREVTAQVAWAAARANCMADGADLWIPDTAMEAAAWDGDWVGITDEATEGTWLTVDGVAATFLPWNVGQPDGGTAENCARNEGTTFEDRECTDQRDYVCECKTN
jgi:hypothetical protein